MNEKEALDEAKRNLVTHCSKLENRIRSIHWEGCTNATELLLAKRRFMFILIDSFPTDVSTCPYCLLNEFPKNSDACEACEYGKTHGRCLKEGSAYHTLVEALKDLRIAVGKYI